jgi:penicillin-binding protein 1A
MNKHKKSNRVKQFFKVLTISMAAMLGLIACLLGGVYLTYGTTIESARNDALVKESTINDTTFKRAGSTIILDKDNQRIAKISLNTYKYLSLSEVSDYVLQGYIAVEDKNFLSEGGIDYKATIKAALLYLKNGGKATVGGSTLTQQVAKNVLLSQDRTLARKLTEIFLAFELAKRYTKSQILEFYVNNCYYGEGCYGIESAAQYFFSKPAAELTLAEAATLCGISNNPALFNPLVNPEKTTLRRNLILNDMLEQTKITQRQYVEAENSVLKLTLQKPVTTPENYMTSYAIDCTTRALMEQDGFKFQYLFKTDAERKNYVTKYKEAYFQHDKQIRSGGYTIHTALDVSKQALLQSALDNGLSDFTDINPANKKYSMQGAAVSIDNKTGYVVAIVGGRGDTDIFNRAFLSFRQPGSSIKPVLDYAPAFDLGYHPLSKITDQFIPNGPKNEENTFYGPVTIRWATEMSLNTVAYQVLTNIKPSTGLAYLGNMQYAGIYPEDNNAVASIGGFTEGVSPVEQAGGYHALVNGGYYTQPSCVTSVDYLEQNTIYQNNQAGKQVYSPEAAYMMTDILKGVISTDYGTGHNLRIPGQIVAGKTGTTEESKDGWFCGYSAYYTTVVWSGYDTPAAVDNLFGSSYPGHIWLDYMTKIHEDLPELDFPKPPGIVFKNIDEQNNPTDIDTGRQDMFSERYLEKTAPEKQAVNQKTDKEKNAGADVPEPDKEGIAERAVLQAKKSQDDELKREQEADATIATLESLTAKSPQETIDSVYLEAKLRAAIVNDDDKQASYMSRIRAVQQALGLSDAH